MSYFVVDAISYPTGQRYKDHNDLINISLGVKIGDQIKAGGNIQPY